MGKTKSVIAKKLICAAMAVILIFAGLTPAAVYGGETPSQEQKQGTVTVTVEYLEKDGSARYFLEPKAAVLKEGMTVVDAAAAAYAGKGTVGDTGALYGISVTPTGETPVKESLLGDEKWVPFVNNDEVGNKYGDLHDGDVIRLIYTRNYLKDIEDFTPAADTAVGTLSINKNSLITKMGRLSDEQKEANKDVYEQALRAALVNTGSQQDAADAEKLIDGILNPEIPATGVSVTPKSLFMGVGERETLTAALIPENSSDKVTWTSSDENVAAVDEEGNVYAAGEGQAVITAAAGDNARAEVKVTVSGISATGIELDRKSISMAEGEGVRLTASLTPAETTDTVVYKSADTEVAAVDDSGLVVGLKAGKTKITATAGDVSAVCEVEVTARLQAAEPAVIFRHDDGRITEAADGVITLSSIDQGSFEIEGLEEGKTVEWECFEKVSEDGYDSTVVHIATGGRFYPHVGERRATATVRDENGRTKTMEFTLRVTGSGVSDLSVYWNGVPVSEDDPVYLDGSEQKKITVRGLKDGVLVSVPTQALEMSVSGDGSVSSSADGFSIGAQNGASDGESYIYTVALKEDESVSASFKAVHMEVAVTGIRVTCPEVFYIDMWNGLGGQYIGLTAYGQEGDRYEVEILPANASDKSVSWVSHNEDVAWYQAAYNNGIVPKKAGKASFTVISDASPAVSAEVEIEFRYKQPLLSAASSQEHYELKQYDSIELDLGVSPADATEQRFTWSYSQSGIVSVTDGVQGSGNSDGKKTTTHTMTALSPGTVTVTGVPADNTNSPEPVTFTVTVKEKTEKPVIDTDRYVTQNKIHAREYMKKQLEDNYVFESEWAIFTVLRTGGTLSQSNLDAYRDDLERELNSGSRMVPTDYFRIVMALLAMDDDPENFRGANVLAKLYDFQGLENYTSNMMTFTLLAYDAGGFEIPSDALWQREDLIGMILAFQNKSNGGFGLVDNVTVSVDITAMTLQALAPYNTEEWPEVQEAFATGLEYLRGQLRSDCGYYVEGGDNACSVAQVIIALCSAGIDPLDPDNGFVRGEATLITKLDDFRQTEGFSTYTDQDGPDGLASYQIACALEAYDRFLGGKNGVYDLTDAEAGGVIPDGGQESGGAADGGESENGGEVSGGKDDKNTGDITGAETPAGGDPVKTGDDRKPAAATSLMAAAGALAVYFDRKKRRA